MTNQRGARGGFLMESVWAGAPSMGLSCPPRPTVRCIQLTTNQLENDMNSRAQKILERSSRTPEFQAAEAEEASEHVESRKAEIAEKVTIEADRTKELQALHKAGEAATTKLEKAQRTLIAAQGEFNQTKTAVHNVNARADAALAGINADLRGGAIPHVREFLDSIYAVWEHERRRWHWLAPVDRKGVKMPAKERIGQIKNIRACAEELYFEPDREVAQAALAKLEAEIKLPAGAAA